MRRRIHSGRASAASACPPGAFFFLDDSAVEQVDAALGMAREPRIVRHHADRRPALVQLTQEPHDGLTVLRVEISGRFVREQNQRFTRNGPRDGDALLLTAGELRGIMLDAMRHPDALERLLHALAPLRGRHAAIRERQLDVLVDGEIADQVEGLEDESDLSVPNARPIRSRQRLTGLTGQRVLPGGGRVEQPNIESRVVLPHPDGPPIATYSPSRISRWTSDQRVRLHFLGIEHLGDAVEFDEAAAPRARGGGGGAVVAVVIRYAPC